MFNSGYYKVPRNLLENVKKCTTLHQLQYIIVYDNVPCVLDYKPLELFYFYMVRGHHYRILYYY